VDPCVDFIAATLKQYPTLRATRLDAMVKARGFTRAVRTLREYVATVRPKPRGEALLRLEMLPGEQARLDSAHAGKLRVTGGERPGGPRAARARRVQPRSAHALRDAGRLQGARHLQREETVLVREQCGVDKTMLALNLAQAALEKLTRSASPRSPPHWRTCSSRSRCQPSSD
jgi:hypothetical protein